APRQSQDSQSPEWQCGGVVEQRRALDLATMTRQDDVAFPFHVLQCAGQVVASNPARPFDAGGSVPMSLCLLYFPLKVAASLAAALQTLAPEWFYAAPTILGLPRSPLIVKRQASPISTFGLRGLRDAAHSCSVQQAPQISHEAVPSPDVERA